MYVCMYVCASVSAKQYNLVPVTGQRYPATGKVTLGVASHACIKDFQRLNPFFHVRPQGLKAREMNTLPTHCGVWHHV